MTETGERARRHTAGTAPDEPRDAVPVTMLLLGDPAGDMRVIKTTRSLQRAGYRVALFCLAEPDPGRPLPDLAGATVRWVAAPRPLARLASWKRRLGPRPQAAVRGQGPDVPANARRRLASELRALAGTLWLNVALACAARKSPASIVHANDLDTLPAASLLRRRGSFLVYDSHELYPEMFSNASALYVGLWRLIEHRLIRGADGVITVNPSIAGELQRRHRLAALPAVVMNCPPAVPAMDARGAAGKGLPLQLVYHGRFQEERGLETAIRAMSAIDAGVVLSLRGSGPLRPRLERLAAACGVQRRVRFLEPLPPDRLVEGLPPGGIGLVPYLPTCLNNYYCTPNKLFDYLMGGLAVVAGDLPELRRAVVETGAGLVYQADDPAALAGAVNDLVADPERRARCALAARRAALGRYHWEAQETALLALYAGLVGRSGARDAPRPAPPHLPRRG